MCSKPMENQWFCMTSAWILCPIVFAPSYLGLVLSLRDVELRPRSWCPEVASNYFALTFSVSRCRFGIFTLMRPAAGLFFFLEVSGGRACECRWRTSWVHPNVAVLNRRLDNRNVPAKKIEATSGHRETQQKLTKRKQRAEIRRIEPIRHKSYTAEIVRDSLVFLKE